MRGRRHRVLIEMGQQEIRRRILLGRSLRRDECEHDLVPGNVGGKAVAEEFLELVAMDARRAGLPPDEQIRPHGRPIPRVAGILEQPLDDGGPFRRVVVKKASTASSGGMCPTTSRYTRRIHSASVAGATAPLPTSSTAF